MIDNIKEENGVMLQGHIKISNPETGEIIVDKRNAIHYENMSISLAESLANAGQGTIYQMAFGNGGTSIDPTGIIATCFLFLIDFLRWGSNCDLISAI